MSVICTVQGSQYWQQLCNGSTLNVYTTFESAIGQLDNDFLIEMPLVIEQLSKVIESANDVVIVIPPPHIILQQNKSSDLVAQVNNTQAQLESLISLYKSNRNKVTILPISVFCDESSTEILPDALQVLSFDPKEQNQNIDSVICHSLLHQNATLFKTYRKLESCFLVGANDSLLLPDLAVVRVALENEAAHVNDVQFENSMLLEQVQLVLEALEARANATELAATEIAHERSENEKLKANLIKLEADDKAKSNRVIELEATVHSLEKSNNEASAKLSDERQVLSNLTQELSKLKQTLLEKNDLAAKSIKELESERTARKSAEKLQAEYLAELDSSKKAYTALEKLKSRELKKLENKLATKLQLEYQLRSELAELRAIKQSKFWKVSSRVEKLSHVVDKSTVKRKQLMKDISLLYLSELFDSDWYLDTYHDVRSEAVDPAEHYLLFGAHEGRRPSAQFDGSWYLERYPDVAEAQMNPLIHYIKYGRKEGRSVSPVMITFNNK